MAEVGGVYAVTPAPRSPPDILARADTDQAPAPAATDKWVTASVVETPAAVIADVFDEGDRRDPQHNTPGSL